MGYQINEPLPLSVSVGDNGENYVRAVLRGPGGVLPQSPLIIPYEGNGIYSLSNFLMPAVSWVRVIYLIFQDSNFTIPSDIYGASTETFDQEIASGGGGGLAPTIIGKVIRNQIIEGVVEHD